MTRFHRTGWWRPFLSLTQIGIHKKIPSSQRLTVDFFNRFNFSLPKKKTFKLRIVHVLMQICICDKWMTSESKQNLDFIYCFSTGLHYSHLLLWGWPGNVFGPSLSQNGWPGWPQKQSGSCLWRRHQVVKFREDQFKIVTCRRLTYKQTYRQTDRITHTTNQYAWKIFDFRK